MTQYIGLDEVCLKMLETGFNYDAFVISNERRQAASMPPSERVYLNMLAVNGHSTGARTISMPAVRTMGNKFYISADDYQEFLRAA